MMAKWNVPFDSERSRLYLTRDLRIMRSHCPLNFGEFRIQLNSCTGSNETLSEVLEISRDILRLEQSQDGALAQRNRRLRSFSWIHRFYGILLLEGIINLRLSGKATALGTFLASWLRVWHKRTHTLSRKLSKHETRMKTCPNKPIHVILPC